MKEKIVPYLSSSSEFIYVVICGLAKSGTSLPLTLLDSHPQLTVFPEELRFMDSGCQYIENTQAVNKLIENGNTQQLKAAVTSFEETQVNYGTGYGKRDYSDIDFDVFTEALTIGFSHAESVQQRYFAAFLALEIAKGGSFERLKKRPLLVSKAPHNEVYMRSWQQNFEDQVAFVWVVRDPVEHYFSMQNIAKNLSTEGISLDNFCELLNSRFSLMKMQTLPTIFIRYEDLIDKTKSEVMELATFLNIHFNDNLLNPTKNGIQWKGNSSRGLIDAKVFSNPMIARQELGLDEVENILQQTEEYRQLFQY